ncbi:hypothetical protein [Parasitella parasitica]|uniref:Uncharacterized protein n=1 Tax=Parasitella parasitica TaxID=35722 RepID=A0A0B7ND10_9FUNG|nr:hypothetical protein [Parasitella parasitica]
MVHQETCNNVSFVTGSLNPTSPRFIGLKLLSSAIPISDDVVSRTSRMSIDPDLFKVVKAASINVEHARVKEAESLLDKHATSSELQETRQAVIEAEKRMIHIKSLLDHTRNQSVSESHHHHVERTETDNVSSVFTEKIVVRDLPLFDLVNDDTKATFKGQFNSVAQFFKDFETMFRLQSVDIKKFWNDNLANVTGSENADWCADTVEADRDLSYEAANRIITSHFESLSKAIKMFTKLVALKQRNEEVRFIRTAHAAHVPNSKFLARFYIYALTKYLLVNVLTSLSSNFGASLLGKLSSCREVEALVLGLEINNPQVNGNPDHSKSANNHSHKKVTPKVMDEIPGGKLSTRKMFHDCHKPRFKGHRCSEFLGLHKRNKNSAEEQHDVRSIHHMNECVNK